MHPEWVQLKAEWNWQFVWGYCLVSSNVRWLSTMILTVGHRRTVENACAIVLRVYEVGVRRVRIVSWSSERMQDVKLWSRSNIGWIASQSTAVFWAIISSKYFSALCWSNRRTFGILKSVLFFICSSWMHKSSDSYYVPQKRAGSKKFLLWTQARLRPKFTSKLWRQLQICQRIIVLRRYTSQFLKM